MARVEDVRNAEAGDSCPRCGATLEINSCLEIGHVFKLGTKYSKSMGATYLDEKGHEVHAIMGCYGIGINRIVAGAVEAAHDPNGILWPLALAPYHVVVVPLQVQNAAVMEQARAPQTAGLGPPPSFAAAHLAMGSRSECKSPPHRGAKTSHLQ